MSKEDKIKELFAEKLGAHETPVNPELWNAIASQIGTAAAVTSTGLSIVAKVIISISAASIIGAGAYFITRNTADQVDTHEKQNFQLITEDTSKSNEGVQEPEASEKSIEENNSIDVSTVDIKEIYTGKGSPAKNPDKNQNDENSENHSLPLVKPDKNKDFSPFSNQPTPNLVGEQPTPAPVAEKKAPVKIEEKQNKITESTDKTEVKTEEAKPSFEITKLPNVYVLNANGYFSIGHKGEYSDFQITIMDDRNNVIFSSNKPDFEWRGTDLTGNQIEQGNYIYIVTAKDLNGKAVNKYSRLTVINQ